jgi:hypothetical protein
MRGREEERERSRKYKIEIIIYITVNMHSNGPINIFICHSHGCLYATYISHSTYDD